MNINIYNFFFFSGNELKDELVEVRGWTTITGNKKLTEWHGVTK